MQVRLWCSEQELDQLIHKSKDATRRQRLRVIRWSLAGLTADQVAQRSGLCRRQVQNWLRRFNAAGLPGLEDRPGRGRPCPLSVAQQQQLHARLAAGPTAADEVCTLRGEDIQRILRKEFGVLRKLSAVYHLLHALGYSSLVPRPRHVQADAVRQEHFKKTSCHSGSTRSVVRIRDGRSKSSFKTKPGSANKAR
jgi:transposase